MYFSRAKVGYFLNRPRILVNFSLHSDHIVPVYLRIVWGDQRFFNFFHCQSLSWGTLDSYHLQLLLVSYFLLVCQWHLHLTLALSKTQLIHANLQCCHPSLVHSQDAQPLWHLQESLQKLSNAVLNRSTHSSSYHVLCIPLSQPRSCQ